MPYKPLYHTWQSVTLKIGPKSEEGETPVCNTFPLFFFGMNQGAPRAPLSTVISVVGGIWGKFRLLWVGCWWLEVGFSAPGGEPGDLGNGDIDGQYGVSQEKNKAISNQDVI